MSLPEPKETVVGPVVVVAGPTASGKSLLAADIAEQFGGVVINADSMQVYRGIEMLSAAPDAVLQARVPHRLYGILDPAEPCSAGDWRERAIAEIRIAHDRGALPVVTGGTGMYLRALMTGLARMPPIPDDIRSTIRHRMEAEGSVALYEILHERDPATAAMLSPGDRQRISRGLELLEATGRGLHAWQKGGENLSEDDIRFFSILLLPPREALYRAVEARFDEMVRSGALDEVRQLAARELDPALPIMKALGVPDLLRHIGGEIDRDAACRGASQATRRYVKRQFTWFMHQFIANIRIDTQYSEIKSDNIFSEISSFLLTPRD
jgi:tRNA dimethylallyltransferase